MKGWLALSHQCHQILQILRELTLEVPQFLLVLAQITHAKRVPSLGLTLTRHILQLNVTEMVLGRPQVWRKRFIASHSEYKANMSLVSEIWEQCYSLSERFCFDPPTPPFNGGQYDWNTAFIGGFTPYNTFVTYTCGLGRQLVKYTPNDTIFYDSIDLHCEWNRTWTPTGPVC